MLDMTSWQSDPYVQTHALLVVEHGPAKKYKCSAGCGKQAYEWAYLHNSVDERQSPRGVYAGSDAPDCYAPLCRRCHRELDRPYSQLGVKVGEVLREKHRTDPEFHTRIVETSRQNVMSREARRKIDPEFDQQMRAKMSVSAKARWADNPEGLQELARRGGAKGGARQRFRCDVCGKETVATALGVHQKTTGHVGKTRVVGVTNDGAPYRTQER